MHLRGVSFSYSSHYENQQLLPVPALFWGEATTNKAQSAYRTESGSINPWSDQTDLVFTQFFQCSPFFPMFTIFLASSPFSQRMTACLPTSVPPKKIQSRRPSLPKFRSCWPPPANWSAVATGDHVVILKTIGSFFLPCHLLDICCARFFLLFLSLTDFLTKI